MKRGFEFAAFTLTLGLLLLGIFRFFEAAIDFGQNSVEQASFLFVLWLVAALFGWVLADFFSGLVHFIADNFGEPTTPLLGPLFIAPFREHHRWPEAMLKHGFLERNANNAVVTSPLLLWIPGGSLSTPLLLFGAALCLHLSGWLLLTNEIHARCHLRPARGPACLLQRWGIILPPEQHDIHHAAAVSPPGSRSSDRKRDRFHYCITSGVCDRLARRLARFPSGDKALLKRRRRPTRPPAQPVRP